MIQINDDIFNFFFKSNDIYSVVPMKKYTKAYKDIAVDLAYIFFSILITRVFQRKSPRKKVILVLKADVKIR